MSDWSKDIDLEVIKKYLQECAENDDYHYEQYQVDIVMHEYIRQRQIIEGLNKEIERLNNKIKQAIEYIENNSLYEQDYDYDYEENLVEGVPDDSVPKRILLEILKDSDK